MGAQPDAGLGEIRKLFFYLKGRCLAPEVEYKGKQIKILCNKGHCPFMEQAGVWSRAPWC